MTQNLDESQFVHDGLQAFAACRAQRDAALKAAAEWEHRFIEAHTENALLRDRLAKVETQLAYYLQRTTEVETHLRDSAEIITRALRAAQQPRPEPVEDQVPRFLLERAEPANG